MPPFINIEVPLALNGVTVVYTLDMMLSSLILLKSYLLLRVYEHVSKWTNYEAKKTTLPFGLETNYHFAFKSDVRSNNLLVFLVIGLVFVLYISTLIFNFESNYVEPRLGDKFVKFFNQYQNAVWMELTSILGVGFGDGYPASIPARFIQIFCCLAALLTLSLIIKIVYARLALTPKESSAYHLLLQDVQMQQNQLEAREVIIMALQMRKASREVFRSEIAYNFQKREFLSKINDFSLTLQMYSFQVLSLNRYINQLLENMQKNLVKTKAEFDKIPQLLEKMKKYRDRKREQNMKVQYLTFIQSKVFDFMASRSNGYVKEFPNAALGGGNSKT
jgi:hypothetical protein